MSINETAYRAAYVAAQHSPPEEAYRAAYAAYAQAYPTAPAPHVEHQAACATADAIMARAIITQR